MAAKAQGKPMMTDAGIRAKTGKGWDYWFPALDKAGAARLQHHAIAALLEKKFRVEPWWGQMISVSYERARGLRAMNQKCDGEFSVGVSKVMPADLRRLFGTATAGRSSWFPRGSFVESSRTEGKYWRGTWGRKGARLEINFYAKTPDKAQIVVQVNKLESGDVIESERASWKKALLKLEALLG